MYGRSTRSVDDFSKIVYDTRTYSMKNWSNTAPKEFLTKF